MGIFSRIRGWVGRNPKKTAGFAAGAALAGALAGGAMMHRGHAVEADVGSKRVSATEVVKKSTEAISPTVEDGKRLYKLLLNIQHDLDKIEEDMLGMNGELSPSQVKANRSILGKDESDRGKLSYQVQAYVNSGGVVTFTVGGKKVNLETVDLKTGKRIAEIWKLF